MTDFNPQAAPAWAARFLDGLRAGQGVRAACSAAGVTSSTPYHYRERCESFRAAWDVIAPVDGRTARHAGPRRKRGAAARDRFIAELAHTSNVSAAAAVAGIAVGTIYKLRRSDPDFARQWYDALAEGYDNLEMELLGRLRAGDGGGENPGADAGASTKKGKFDTTAALRCLAAHRESVAREKGRRALETELITIAAINAKIDRLRLRASEGEKAIRRGRKAAAKRKAQDGGVQDAGGHNGAA